LCRVISFIDNDFAKFACLRPHICLAGVYVVLESCVTVNLTFGFYSAPQSSHCKRCTSYGNSVCLSVRPSDTRQYCVKTTTRSTVQFALSDSKMCLVL